MGKKNKKICIFTIGSIVSLFILYIILACVYWYVYIPYKISSLYKEGLSDIRKANTNAIELIKMHNANGVLSYSKAIEVLENSYRNGNTISAVLLGRIYKGYNIEKGYEDSWYICPRDDYEKSSYWYLQAAKKGNAEAQSELGHNYMYGLGVKQNFQKALYWLKSGADNGNPIAQWRLGNAYLHGLAYYDGCQIYFRGPYETYNYSSLIYLKGNMFVSKANRIFEAKETYLNEILENPSNVYLKQNIGKAKYYWKLAANQGLQDAKDALEKIYD